MVEEVEAAINPYAFWKDGLILLRVDRPFTLSTNLRSHSAFVDHNLYCTCKHEILLPTNDERVNIRLPRLQLYFDVSPKNTSIK